MTSLRRQRNVKIVATLGPASDTYEMIRSLFVAGADVFRLNMSYNLGRWGEIFGVIDNLTNEDPPMIAGSFGAGYYQGQSNVDYDRIGRRFTLGYRGSF